ncbi:metal ABC transporter substrate-binding protein [Streptomyces radicis]|uniref:Zinc ABC transporter substrate-binding protein n=1 Tax=Streptomyces radicis TaxID=1750517 RepID=A0A3A9WI03_9ACTN|nr:metal ABC transporter substrate-binding protein [Streptomyces radicis]RKN11943.1 zinc ABC transporter substrate-binding protein [Streptomyces radicis]RKN26006.1 zinc ABC transporter substrate-binding protein [Streptomyces radicis]
MAVMTARRRSRSRIRTPALAAGATALGLLALSACGSDDGGGGGDEGRGGDGRLSVVASFYPMEFLVERIGGDHVSVETLTEPGAEPHDLEITPRQTASLHEAGLVVYLAGLQPAVDDAIEQSGAEHVAEATSFTTLHEEEGAEDEGHAEDEGAEEEHDHEHEGGLDPHVWLDPLKYGEIAEGVGAALADADPDNAADYERATAELTDELTALDQEFSEGLATAETDTFITAHAAFGYLAERYGLHQESIAGLDPESEPSAARMRELQEIAEADGVTTVFFETLVSDETARTLAGDLGIDTAVLDPLEGITEDSPGADYLAVMRANLEALRLALGAA